MPSQKEKRLLSLITHNFDAVTLINPLGKVLYASPSIKQVLGYTPAELIGRNGFKLVHPRDLPSVTKALTKIMLKKGTTATIEVEVKRKGGSWTWVEVVGTNLLTDPDVGAIVANFRDITKRKQAAEQLRLLYYESQKFYAAVEQTADAVFIVDSKGIIEYVNSAFEILTGYTKAEAINKTPRFIKSGVHDLKFYHTLWSTIMSGKPFRSIVVNKKKNGDLFYADHTITPIKDSDGKILRFVGIWKDVTERKRMEDNLAHLASLVDSSSDAIWSKTLDNRIISWNKGAELMYGYKAQEAIGKDITSLVVPLDKKGELEKITRKAQRGIRMNALEAIHITKEGVRLDVSMTISPLKDPQGKVVAISAIVRDITAKKEFDERKSEFISMASHELKTPVTSMNLFIEVLEKRLAGISDERVKKSIASLKEQANRLKDLVSDLLDISRIETGKLRFHYETFRIDESIEEMIESLAVTIQRHKIQLLQKEPLTVYGDRHRMHQVLINLIINAIKYSPQEEKINVKVVRDNTNALVSVKDFGIGIAKKDQQRIFERLYQGTNAEEKTFPGLGMGLYISKEIITRHGGDIWVESAKGKGSTFYFRIPLAKSK